MRFPPHFLEEIKARLPVSSVVGKSIQLKKAGREHKACCPFHTEKSPSFTVVDDKDFYHCFGCGAHGGVFDFVMEHEGLTFPEAVEKLAGIAGLPLPQPTPEDRQRYERLLTLHDLATETADFYYENLKKPIGQATVEYLKGRGITGRTAKEFQLGYASDARNSLKQHLLSKGAKDADMVAAGLAIKPESGGQIFDRFRGRLMFPITSLNGKVIGFGGRILDPNTKAAKYMNSPESDLFHKGKILYSLRRARQHSQGENIIVVEGYMDVISLFQAGIRNAVAPLGTALTEDQIQLLWKYVDQITLCFDGDEAGQRAANNTVERLLPILQPGKEIRFVHLPTGEDPDDVVKKRGANAFAAMVQQAQSLSAKIFEMEAAAKPLLTPEAKAEFYTRLDKRTKQIQDWDLQKSYRDYFKQTAWTRFRTNKSFKAANVAANVNEGSGVRTVPNDILRNAQALCLALYNHPALLDDVAEQFGSLPLPTSDLEAFRSEILAQFMAHENIRTETAEQTVHKLPPDLSLMFSSAHPDTPLEAVRSWWLETYGALKNKLAVPPISPQDDDLDVWWAKNAQNLAQSTENI